jgi:hypothetical protein
MSFQPYDRRPSGIVFFGNTSSEALYESASNFIFNSGTSTLSVPNVAVADGGNIGSASDPDAISIASNGAVTFTQGVSIAGNLTVNGTTTTVNSTVVTIQDPIIILGSGSPTADDNKDRGISFNYHTGSVAKTGFFGYDDSTGKFTFIPDATITSEVVSGSSGIIVASLEGNVAGNATTATTLATARNFSVTGETTAGAQSFNGGADVLLTTTLDKTAITNRTELTGAIDGTGDYLLIYDQSVDALRKVNRTTFITGLGSMSSFTLAGDTGANQTISDSDTVRISGGAGLATVGSATDTLTVNLALSELSAVAVGSGDSFLALDSDGTTHQRSTVSQLGTYLAGTNVTAGGDGKLSVTDASIEGVVFTAANFVDSSRIDFTVTAGASVTADLIASSVTETYLSTSVAGSGLVGGGGVALRVGAGLGITVNNDDVALASTTAGSGLTYAAGVLNLGTGNGITVNADSVELATTTAGSGLTYAAGVLNIGTGNGITVNADSVELASTTAGSGLSYSAGIIHVNVDNSGIEINSDILRIKDGGIPEAKRSRTVETITASKTADKDVTLINATGVNVTLTLPENGGTIGVGRMMVVKRIDSSSSTVTISRQTADTIDGATSVQLYHRYETMTFVTDGADWYII